jgi:hypothetical protein
VQKALAIHILYVYWELTLCLFIKKHFKGALPLNATKSPLVLLDGVKIVDFIPSVSVKEEVVKRCALLEVELTDVTVVLLKQTEDLFIVLSVSLVASQMHDCSLKFIYHVGIGSFL